MVWAAAVVGVACVPIVISAVSERYWWFYAGLALWAGLLLLLRRHLFDPLVRVRPWQRLDKQTGRANWGMAFLPLWIPLTTLVPDRPMWIGPVVGALAGICTYQAMTKLGEPR